MEFVLGLAWCLSGYLAWKIGEKLDQKNYGPYCSSYLWQDKICGLIFGPIMLIMLVMEYLKQRKRAKYTPCEMVNPKKDIYDLWDWFLGDK